MSGPGRAKRVLFDAYQRQRMWLWFCPKAASVRRRLLTEEVVKRKSCRECGDCSWGDAGMTCGLLGREAGGIALGSPPASFSSLSHTARMSSMHLTHSSSSSATHRIFSGSRLSQQPGWSPVPL